ncbi:MAG: hypothetical protein ACOC38_11415 [Promethearchaeia archaeon]
MSDDEPTYWGSWKGRVVKAIAVNGTRTWNEIRYQTGLSPKTSPPKCLVSLLVLRMKSLVEVNSVSPEAGVALLKSVITG